MSYQITFTETNNPAKPPIAVADQTLNTQTSITFVGKNYAGYAPIIATDLLHLLENFSSPTAPTNPVQGQLWYDNTNGVNLLKVYDGTTWNAAGSVKKASTAPSVANSTTGDLWVDTVNQQLYLFSGSNWLLVGPQFSSGTLTGPQVEVITDADNVNHNVIALYSNNYRIAIISKDSFTPKATITGFTTGIKQGFTLSSVDSNSATTPTRFHGTATSADGLLINNEVISSSNFIRGDLKAGSSISNIPLNVRSDGGISVGSNLSFNVGTDGNSTILYNKVSGSGIQFKLINANVTATTMYLDPTIKVGIGANNTSPATTLDVKGAITVKDDIDNTIAGRIQVTGTGDIDSLTGASIETAGGLKIDKQSRFGDDIFTYGQTFISYETSPNVPTAAPVIVPRYSNNQTEASTLNIPYVASGQYDIGTATRKFRNIYADAFVGTFNGNFTGSLTGSISGAAAKLASPTVFSLVGDVTSNALSFDGQTETGTAIFTTSINAGIITSKTVASDSTVTDQFLVYRSGVGLLNMTKQVLLNHVPTVPIGAIFPYAGSGSPSGYLLCDGSEVKISDYPALYSIIGYLYKTSSLLIGQATFALPDLRGRFPLGKDDMYNGLQVPARDGSGTLINAGGGQASRVADVTARTVGASGGIQSVTLSQSNLPDHQHTLSDSSGSYYAMPGSQATGASDTNASANIQVATGTSTAYGLGRTGSITGVSQLGTSINNMNPYQTINYIIFTGVL